MALKPRKGPITREQVYKWVVNWNNNVSADPTYSVTLENFITNRVNNLALPDPLVDTSGHDDLDDVTPVLNMILADLPSYTLPRAPGS